MPNVVVNKKVTELPVATTVDSTDVLLVVQGGITKQVSQDTVAAAVAVSTQLTATFSPLLTANADGSLNLGDSGWGITTDGTPTFYGSGNVPAGRGATAPIFAPDGSAVLIPTGV